MNQVADNAVSSFAPQWRAFDFATSQPWLITEDALNKVLAIAQRAHEPQALQTERFAPLEGTRTADVRDGVAIIPITGPIFRYANLFTEISGATSTEVLARDIRAAIDNPAVRAIVLEINSPGGVAAGINELADMIYEARERKHIIAYGDGTVASAAYWLASAAHEIVVDAIAVGGSIGARMTIVDASGRDAKAGIRTYDIVSSQSPDKALDVSQDAGRAKIQKIVDDLGHVFVKAVARNRGVDVATVLANYGQGGVKVGVELVASGMADRLGSLNEVVAELSASRTLKRSYAMSTSANKQPANKGPKVVATTAELHAALLAGHTPEEISIAVVDVEKIRAEAATAERTEGDKRLTDAVAKAKAEATAAERTRVSGLQAIGMKGFEKELQAAIDAGTSVETFAVEQAKLAKTRGTTVTAQQADASQAAPHGGAAPIATATKSRWSGVVSKFTPKGSKK